MKQLVSIRRVQTDGKMTISPLPTDYVHGLLLEIAAAVNAPFPEATQAVYLKALGHLDPQTADQMQKRVLAEWDKAHMMPPIAFLLERATRIPFHAEEQWQRVLVMFRHHWHPDIGLTGKPPELDAAAEYALRQIGGLRGFAASRREHEGLIRDRFIEAYGRFHAEGGEQTHFTREFSERFLRQLQEVIRGGTLPVGEGNASEREGL